MRNPQRGFAFHQFGVRLTAAQAVLRPRVRDIAWAAGFYEGEGTCQYGTYSQHVAVNQVEREPLEQLRRWFGGSIYPIPPHHRSVPSFRWAVHGPRARGFLMTIYTLLSKKRQAQIRQVLYATPQ